LALALVAVAAIAPPSHAGSGAREGGGVGRALRLDDGPMMQPVATPARIARVAVVPGSDGAEAWGIGFSFAHAPGWDQIAESGQIVFVHYTRASGWQVDGPPLDAAGKAMNPQIADLALAPDGYGWAAGPQGALYVHAPGRGWRASAQHPTPNSLADVSLGRDARGVYGYAVGAALTFLRFDGSAWTRDSVGGAVPTGAAPELSGVAAVSRDEAWAVSGGNTNQLMVWHRTGGAWQRELTGEAMFDSPPGPVNDEQSGVVNQYAHGNAVAAGPSGVWFSGTLAPIDAARAAGQSGDRTRPFVLRYARGAFTSFCPRMYAYSSSGVARTISPCHRAFPASSGDLPALAVAGDEVFAGGSGFFRFSAGAWAVAPDVVGYVVSASFANAREGWVATQGNIVGASAAATSSVALLGHWTGAPARARLVRWPQPNRAPLESVALDPGTSGGAMAVGRGGAIVRIDPATGVDAMRSPVTSALHAVAWPRTREAWAVGADGIILRFDGAAWRRAPSPTTSSLYAVAFDGRDRGYAVGARGTIVRYDGSAWRLDPASGVAAARKLVAIACARGVFVAAGDKGTIVETRGTAWIARHDLDVALRSGQAAEAPNLLSAAALPGGAVAIGGARSVMIERAPGGALQLDAMPPLEGSVLALSGAGDRVVASMGTGASRYNNDSLAQASGFPFEGDARGWRDIAFSHAAGISPDYDAPVQRDAVYGLALDGARGWAVGGFPSDVFDDDGHLRADATSSVWRVSLDSAGPPEPSPSSFDAQIPRARGISFAFLGETACAFSACGPTTGEGTRADEVLRAALAQIDAQARNGVVRFLAFGGNMRRNGVPDELDQVRALFDGLSVPVYPAIGARDLFAGPAGAAGGAGQAGLLSSNGYFLAAFRGAPAPFGYAPAPRDFEPVRIGASANTNLGARTHYAFDVADGARRVRLVSLDTSRTPLASNVQAQNPAEDQTSWLQDVLADAKLKRIPSVVFMNQALLLPVSASPDASVVTPIVTAGGVSAVLTSHTPSNQLVYSPNASVPGAVPVGIFGSGGAPLGNGWDPAQGAYHAWQLVTVDADPGALSALGQAPVSIRSIPILGSVALHASKGTRVPSGRALGFDGLGRLPDVGGAHGLGAAADQAQGKATYLSFPFPRACTGLETARDGCSPANVVAPEYSFASSDPGVAEFVARDAAHPARPLRDANGDLVRDAHSGLLCTFRPGEVTASLSAGVAGARMPVHVRGGSGPCIPGTFADARAPAVKGEHLAPQPAGHEGAHTELLRPRLPDAAAVGALAPPIVNAAPAPPAGGGGQREEQREAAGEKAEFTALPVRHRAQSPVEGAAIGALLVLGALGLAAGARSRTHARATPAYVRTRGDR
jgi:hypothetical protein